MPLHRVEVAANHVAQLVVPFLLFTPQPVAGIAAAIIIVTQLWLMLSGNFAWLNAVTITLALPALGDGILGWLLPISPPAELADAPLWHDVLVVAVTALVAVLSYRPVANLLSLASGDEHGVRSAAPRQHLRRLRQHHPRAARDHRRGDHAPTRSRRRRSGEEYEFKGKPGDPLRRPPQLAPYHLRLDWLMWFIPLSPQYGRSWFRPFLRRLLADDRDIAEAAAPQPVRRQSPHLRPRQGVRVPVHVARGAAADEGVVAA